MRHILLVEDEPGAVAFIRRCMEAYASEHDLAAFAKAAEALSYAEKNLVDLFILDIQLLVNPVHIYKIDKANRLLYLKECKTAIPIGEKYQKAVFEREKP